MYTVTFYSYRGGVGRTTALVNVAVDLASRGRKVLLVDFDLEAPSVSNFARMRPDGPHLGLVEFIDEYLRWGKAPEIADYVYQIKPVDERSSEVWVMPAGRGDSNYWQAFHKIDWRELYDLRDGFLLFEDIKFQLQESFHPDYVLVDARAGINDRLAICTRQLPDAVVMLFTLDEAVIEADEQAAHRVLRDIVAESVESSPRRIDLLLVESKVPDLDGEYLHESSLLEPGQLEIFFHLAAAIPHAPELLLDRQVISDMGPPLKRLPRAYRRLANALIRSNCTLDPDGARAFLKELQLHPDSAVAVPAANLADRWNDCTAQMDELIVNFGHDVEILAQAASCLFLAGRYERARETLNQAIEQAINLAHPIDRLLWQRASYCRRLHLPGAVDDLLRLLDAPIVPQSKPLNAVGLRANYVPYWLRSLPWQVWDPESRYPESPELDTEPLDTSDPLTHDFSGIDPYVASAFLQLRRLAPEKFQDALQKPRILQLSPEARQALIADAPPPPASDPRFLIHTRQWAAVIALLEPGVAEWSSSNPENLFYLAMAYWGSGNESRATELCRSARELILEGTQPDSILAALDTKPVEYIPYLSFLSLLFWKAGDVASAKPFLDRCDELVTKAIRADGFFSFWRFKSVSPDIFHEDCDSQRRMMQGAQGIAIRPYFLGKGSGSG
jgi:tetratricopeptide (TPR) repeat protein